MHFPQSGFRQRGREVAEAECEDTSRHSNAQHIETNAEIGPRFHTQAWCPHHVHAHEEVKYSAAAQFGEKRQDLCYSWVRPNLLQNTCDAAYPQQCAGCDVVHSSEKFVVYQRRKHICQEAKEATQKQKRRRKAATQAKHCL